MSTAVTTSFQKKSKGKAKGIHIPGSKPSLHNNQLLISTGVPSLDNVIGGGLAIGTVMLIEEDKYESYSHLLLRYFFAEGVMCNHSIFVASADTNTENMLKDLPGPLVDDPVTRQDSQTSVESMKIAWRYQGLPQVQSSTSTSSRFGHYYDLTKTMDDDAVERVSKKLVNVDICDTENCDIMKPAYAKVLHELAAYIDTGQYGTSATQATRTVLRIGLHSLGSPLWGENGGMNTASTAFDPSLPRFLYALRSLMRRTLGVCVITMPSHLFQHSTFTKRLEQLVDTWVQLDSFMGSDREKNPAFKEYHGLFNIIKLPHLNSLTCHMPDTLDLAFKLKRKKFMIERLHLPPELSETVSRDQEDPVQPKKTIAECAGGSTSNKLKLDF